ncbi:DNA-binding response regulator, OmpR family, contains REC and winged-helix (wHTH) domain [Clostridium amylolyticum]|uniref:Stage 0 sporulation protein A homolog n=1 Tax=Clostridium amylolyticum TaxID=1121298 RepID=A0A1M6N393_9CLOT|nr:response regulator transcription factor [Clostridium amylolyticum]SHJ90078.1 DNA-binding response regulator, OmpR family, contains REC and winged-helix (wHTH) domain [Clostridium amylolyticum]
MYKILIVEDDLIIAKTVKNHIKSWGFEVECVNDFKDVLATFVSYNPQLVLLDIALPFFNGYHWCSEIRKVSKVPIIFISSASDNMNIVMAMNMGGDDFIAKPFDLNVLTAKVQALLRRTYDFTGQTNLLEHKGLILNISDSTLNFSDRKIELSKNENKIMQILLENKGKAVSRDTIMTRLWETDSYIDDNTLTVNITRLRKKLQEAGLSNFIATKKGVGYMVE